MRRIILVSFLIGGIIVSATVVMAGPSKNIEQMAQLQFAQMEEESGDAAVEDDSPNWGAWEMDFHGYFRGPLGISLNKRADPDDLDGDERTQATFGTNHLVDGNEDAGGGYYNFGYTRLQEGDWAELLVSAKHKHVAATIGFMGSWYQFVGKGKTNAVLSPGLGWVTLNSDFNLGGMKANIELKTGAFLHANGANGIYDTYLFGRYHLLGEAIKLTLPVSNNFVLALTHGFGGNKNGVIEGSDATAATLCHFLTVGMNIAQKLEIGLYYNSSWSHDPSHYESVIANGDAVLEGPYSEYRDARMRTFGMDIHLRMPVLGHLWVAYSHIELTNGWALSEAVEIMHSDGGAGVAANYMGVNGSGAMNNLTWVYENSIQSLRGGAMGQAFPDLTLTVFGLMAAASRDLEQAEEDAGIDKSLMQIKGGAELTFWPKSWVGIMFRYDGVNLNLDVNDDGDKEFTYHVFTPRVIFKSNFLSNESIWFQLSKYSYGDDAKDAFADISIYDEPDALVFKMQANMSW